MTQRPKCEKRTIKFLEEYRVSLSYWDRQEILIGSQNWLKGNIGKMASLKWTTFVHQNISLIGYKSKLRTGKKYLQHTYSSKWLIPGIYKNSYKWIKKGTHSIEKWMKDLKRQLIKDNTHMSSKNIKICSI